jgi:hypothetical protein
VPLDPEDLPERVEAWGGLDRLVWQDLDSNRLTTGQLASLRGWVAGGGRLVIVGGTAGPNSLSAFPDALLPYRPTATVDIPAASLTSLVGSVPVGTADLPALGGSLIGGRSLVMSGDRVVAAERGYGSGAVTVVGFDPSTKWIADGAPARPVAPTPPLPNLCRARARRHRPAVSAAWLPSLALRRRWTDLPLGRTSCSSARSTIRPRLTGGLG